MRLIPGINTAEGLKHTGNQPVLYMRFLKRFPDDPTFSLLRSVLDAGRVHDAYLCAHTLKGLTAQLGISALYVPLCSLCRTLQSEDPQALLCARKQYTSLVSVYEEIVRLIRELP